MRDHFSAIFGERRGRPGKGEDLEKPLWRKRAQKPFSSRQRVARRRMALARHLKDRWPTPAAASATTLNGELTYCYFREDPTLRADLESLVTQGISRRSGSPGSLSYSAHPFEEWPGSHRQAFSDWEAAGGVQPSKWRD